MPKLKTPVIYICVAHAGFSFRVGAEKPSRFKFIKHVLTVTTQEDVDAIDDLIENVDVFKQKIRKADKAAAEVLARKHREAHGGAVKGMFTSQHSPAIEKPMRERDAAFANLDPEQLDKLVSDLEKDSSLILTEATEPLQQQEQKESKDVAIKAKVSSRKVTSNSSAS